MSRSAHPELIDALSNFSTTTFTELQAAAYIALLKMGGEESGSAIAGESGVNRSKIYDILNQLVEMKAVEMVSIEGRTRYKAVLPKDFFPQLIDKFTSHVSSAAEQLALLRDVTEEIDPVRFTILTISLDDLDANQFRYLISSNDHTRVIFTEKLDRSMRPGPSVRILDLNDQRPDIRGLNLLVSEKETYLFGTPLGKKVDAIHITSEEISNFIIGLIESRWIRDIPDLIMEEIENGVRKALVIDKAVSVNYEEFVVNRKYIHDRPVSVLVTDEHISFFDQGLETPKIPLSSLSSVIVQENVIHAKFVNQKTNQLVGDLTMSIVGNPIYLKNILLLIKERNQKS